MYNIMRISASIVPKEEYRTSSFTQEASGEILDFVSEEEDLKNPEKDYVGDVDAYTLLLPSNESEKKVKVATNNPYKYHLASFR